MIATYDMYKDLQSYIGFCQKLIKFEVQVIYLWLTSITVLKKTCGSRSNRRQLVVVELKFTR